MGRSKKNDGSLRETIIEAVFEGINGQPHGSQWQEAERAFDAALDALSDSRVEWIMAAESFDVSDLIAALRE